MISNLTAGLVAAFASGVGRSDAAQRLAAHIGATAILMLVRDEFVDALVPAPGFAQTLPGGKAWAEFLSRARHAGIHQGEVGFPSAEKLVPAAAYSDAGFAIICLGAHCDRAKIDELRLVAPLLAAMLRAEHTAVVARGEQQNAEDRAREAQVLAAALDKARAQHERALVELEAQTIELTTAHARAEQAGRAKDEFLAMLGHELRNPLSPIVTALQLLRLKNQTSREHEIIERQVQNVMRLVDDLLDVSRITRGKIELKKQLIELSAVAARAIEMASPLLEANRQVLSVDIPARGLLVEADPARLAQVFANLLSNAAKYSAPETKILFSAERDGKRLTVRVKDEGIGIARDMLERVFDLFEQQRQSLDRSQGGLGLGLAIVRSLITLHGGSVHAMSQGDQKGSEFIVEMPCAQGETEPVTSPAQDGLAGAGSGEGRGRRVLVVDDNEDALMLLSEALTSIGYIVRTASDGPQALRIAETFQPELALLDIGLPVMDGYDLARRLRQIRPLQSARLVALTGYGQATDKRRSQDAGFHAHLVKPIMLEELQRALSSDLSSQN
jgi:signal transduction histidine kinase/ActR/RegA family two-component response regulator